MRMQGHTRVTLKYIIFEERDCSINSAYVSKNGSTSVLLVYTVLPVAFSHLKQYFEFDYIGH